jgi:hypothetical protein
MAQPQTKRPQQKNLQELRTSESKNPIPEKFRLPAAIVAILVVLLLFFGKVLGPNKTFQAGDIIASESIIPYLNAAKTVGQNVPQWIPNIFGGMPSFASSLSTGDRTYDLTYSVYNSLRLGAKDIAGDGMLMLFHYFLFGVGVFLFLRISRRTTYTAALFGAFAAMLSTWFLTYAMIGHNTKVFAIALFPYILLCLEKLREEDKSWKGLLGWGGGLALSVHLLLESTHVQMIFYIALCVIIYFVVGLIGDLTRKRNMAPILRTGVIALVAAGLAFAMSADRYMATLSYAPYSIRGTAPLVERGTSDSAPVLNTNKESGLDWEYATAYSFSPGEMITFLVPGWFGFGKLPYSGPEVPQETRIVTYFGQMITTDAANYMGTIVFFLALIAIFALWKRDRLVPALAMMSLFGLLLSFGDNFSLLYKPMFNLFPGFNSFRAPMMALSMMQLAFPLLAALALDKLLRGTNGDEHDRAKIRKGLTFAFYAAAGLTIIFLVGRGAIGSAVMDNIGKSGKQISQYPEGIKQLAVSTAQNDALICLLIAAIALGAIWWFVRNKKAVPAFVGAVVVVLALIDLWRVGTRPFEVTTKADQSSIFRDHDYVSFIKKDPSLYRVLDLSEGTSNVPVAWGLQTIAGYHAAKVRRFQDVVDVTGNANGNVIFNPFMWRLLNVKYVIATGAVDSVEGRHELAFMSQEQVQGAEGQREGKMLVWENKQVLPRAFFVNRYEVKQPLEMLELMRDGKFDPRDVMYFDEQPKDLGTLSSTPVNDSAESIAVTKYENELVDMKTKTSGERLVFFSDTWYPYWTATMDGNTSVPIYRANYAFRAFKVPAGEHTVRFEYHDPKYESGRTMSMIANIIVVIALVGGIAMTFQRKKKEQPPESV